ncbi:hypothetical protein Zmor_015317 [Zophobas morio]|uniref:Zinc finger PHD-type domain-containing protein n=1 Tax=Zophobas morio TaxID=2755281 RepID=A0AA38IIZ9_9CUCU|nr:hypothetical protein Zmor_015317 [Zophobas morio]
MAEALRNVREKKMGWQLASKIFNVPATTLRRRFKNNCNSTKGDLGAIKGRKQVGALSSAERGQNLTVVCCMNAMGTFVPLAFIFPRKRMKNELMDNAPMGSKAYCQLNGWMCSEIFVQCLEHFVHYTKASNENKVLLLLDGHSSHKSLEVLQYTKDNGIILFCLPTHCTHRLQPLDTRLKQHPGRIVTHFQVAGLFNKAYLKAATPANAVHAFAKTGIYPFDDNIFPDWMFQPSSTTDRPLTEHDQCQNGQKQPQQGSVDVELPKLGSGTPEATEVEPSTLGFAKAKELSPLPQASLGASRKRLRKPSKKGHINSTPDIDELKKEVEEKTTKEREKLSRTAKRKILVEEEADYVSDNEKVEDTDDDEADVACLYCNDIVSRSKTREIWISCQSCGSWCHSECAGVEKRIKQFICEFCE